MRNRGVVLFLAASVLGFVLARVWYLSQGFHFLHDQALFSYEALKLWRDKEVVLIGPPASWNVEGRHIFQGSAIYYLWMLLLLGANFDPLGATLVFVVAAGLMIIPLYRGVAGLANARAGMAAVLLYSFLPRSIRVTSELWNPHLQYALVPGLIWVIWRYREHGGAWWLFSLGAMVGFLLQLHYQFLLPLFYLLAWVLWRERSRIARVGWYFLGLGLGVAPLLLFEVRHNWYNLETAGLIFARWGEVTGSGPLPYHYLLSVGFLVGVGIIVLAAKYLRTWHLYVLAIGLLLSVPGTVRQRAIWEQELSWSLADEVKAYSLIRAQGVSNYNVTAFYQGVVTPQRYLHLKDGIELTENYYTNRYLFVIYPDESFGEDTAYEMSLFRPAIKRGEWVINGKYRLYLLERVMADGS